MEPVSYRFNNTDNAPKISLPELYSNIEYLNKKKLELEDQTLLCNIFASSIHHLQNDSNIELRSKLSKLLFEVLKLENFNPEVHDLAKSVDSFIRKTINQSLNISYFLRNREVGYRNPKIPLDNGLANRFLNLNLREGNYTKTNFSIKEQREITSKGEFNFQPDITQIDLGNNCAVLACDTCHNFISFNIQNNSFYSSIKLLNLNSKKIEWEYKPKPPILCFNFCKLIGNHVIVQGAETEKKEIVKYKSLDPLLSNENYEDPSMFCYSLSDYTIRIIDVRTGKETASIREVALKGNATVNFNKIYCSFEDNRIGEWDFNGKFNTSVLTESYASEIPKLFCSTSTIVEVRSHDIVVYDLSEIAIKKINHSIPLFINSPQIDFDKGIQLRCLIDDSYTVVNLDNGKARAINLKFFNRHITLPKIHVDPMDENLIYVSTNNVVWKFVCNEENAEPKFLGEHLSQIAFLFKIKEGPFLVSGSLHQSFDDSELKIWDTNAMTLIKEWSIPNLKSAHFVNQNLIARTTNSLIKLDFFIPHKGERVSEDSPISF